MCISVIDVLVFTCVSKARKVPMLVYIPLCVCVCDMMERCHARYIPHSFHIGGAVYVGQEILDAFPVYQFVKTDGAWREKMVDVDVDPDSPFHFR